MGSLSPISITMCAILSWSLLLPQSVAAQPSYADHQIKAVFLYHFTKFINWPETAFPSADSPFNICTTGSGPLSEVLTSAISGEVVAGHPLQVISQVGSDQVPTCHILYIPAGYDSHLLWTSKNSGVATILTVSDDETFINQGGIIKLESTLGRVRPVINTTALDRAELKASAKLLQLATLVSE